MGKSINDEVISKMLTQMRDNQDKTKSTAKIKNNQATMRTNRTVKNLNEKIIVLDSRDIYTTIKKIIFDFLHSIRFVANHLEFGVQNSCFEFFFFNAYYFGTFYFSPYSLCSFSFMSCHYRIRRSRFASLCHL